MKLVFVNIMQEVQRFDSTAYITQPPVPLAVLNAATPKEIETGLLDEQTDPVELEGDVFAFSVSTQNALAVYEHADALRAAGKTVIMGGIHITVCPEEAIRKRDDGIVVMDYDLCTGCQACMDACPYDAISYDHDQNIANKCNLCHHRIDQGLIPACADNVCLAHCINFISQEFSTPI